MDSDILSQKQKTIVKPYSKLAYIYDEVMSHVDYERWARYIERLIKKYQPQCQSLLDISCGTGKFLLSLSSKETELVGFDISFEMVKIAREKNKARNDNIYFFQGDMASFSMKKKFNVVVCLYDSINYLKDFNLWQKLFSRVTDVLHEKGIFIFDICTKKNSLKYFNNYSERSGGENYEYVRESEFDQKKGTHKNKFLINISNESCYYIETHVQRIFAIKEVLKFIQSTKFRMLAYYDGFTFIEGSENSLRVHFVLQRN